MTIPCRTSGGSQRSIGVDQWPYTKGDRPDGHQIIHIRKGNVLKPRKVIILEDGIFVEKMIDLPGGEIVRTVEGANLVLDRAKVQMANLFVGNQVTTRYVNRMSFGTGGHQPGDTSSPINPLHSDR